MNVSLEIVKGFIKNELNLVDLPITETFKNLGFLEWQLERVHQCFAKSFQKNVRPLFSDTVLSYTERLLSVDNTIPTPEKVIASAKQDPLI